MTQWLTPSEAAKVLGVSVQTLRKYDKLKLIKTYRNERGHRVYDVDSLIADKKFILIKNNFMKLNEEDKIELLKQLTELVESK